MKFLANPTQLKPTLSRMVSVIEARQTIPILANVLMQLNGNTLSMQATDLDIEIRESIQVQGNTDGETTVSASMLKDIIGKLDDSKPLVIQLDAGYVKIKSGGSNFKLHTLPVADYPKLANDTFTASLEFSGDELKRAIDKTVWAVSTETTRYYLNGIALQIDNGAATFIATDGHRLAKFVSSVTGDTPNIIIPTKAAKLFSAVLTPDDVTLHISDGKVRLTAGDVVLTSRVIDGTYPAWQRVLPQATNQSVTASSDDLAKAVDRVQVVMSEKTRIVKMSIREGELSLHAPQRDFSGEATDTIDAVKDGPDLDIGVSAKYALDAMRQADKGSVTIQYGEAGDPLLISYDKEPELTVVVMPARL